MGVEDSTGTGDKDTGAKVDASKVDANPDGKDTGTETKKDDDASGLKSALNKERKRAEQAEKKLRDAELAKLPELERAQAEAKALTDENEKLKLENTRYKIALDMGLPWNLARRVDGATEEEMRADAADLLKDFKRDAKESDKDIKTPTNDGKKGGRSSGKADMNTLLRAAAGRA